MPERNIALVIAAGCFVATVAVLVGGVLVVLAVGTMGGHMGMMGGRSTASQTPVVSEEQAVSVEIRDYAYSPNDLTVRPGTKVTWTNRDAAPHDATADDKGWKTDILANGDIGSVTFDTPGTYPYHCSIHPYMKGTITVQA